MRSFSRSSTLLALALILGSGSLARAADEGDRNAIQGTISHQIEALRHDDAAGAYALAGPMIQGMFPTPEAFIGMVQRGYRAVYRPRSFTFGKTEDAPDGAVAQSVQIQDEEGVDWLALYTLERQPDGAWKITGCSLKKAPGQTV